MDILSTKLMTPRVQDSSFLRVELISLTSAQASKCIVIEAPAGFGKTTFALQYLQDQAEQGKASQVSWLTLDQLDNTPQRFWKYLIIALRKLDPEIGLHALNILQASGMEAIELVLDKLLYDIDLLTTESDDIDFTLVIDDLHKIDNESVIEQFNYFLDRVIQHFNLILIARECPDLKLIYRKSRCELYIVEADQLAFSQQESEKFLSTSMEHLSTKECEEIYHLTAGWPAALQLIRVSHYSVQNQASGPLSRKDLSQIKRLLWQEIVSQKNQSELDFLIETSHLPRLRKDLCIAVTGKPEAAAILERLLDTSVFINTLGTNNDWFQYHDLLKEVCFEKLGENPERLLECRKRAVTWLESNFYITDAWDQAIATQDWNYIVEFLERVSYYKINLSETFELKSWISHIPEELLWQRPILLCWLVWSMSDTEKVSTGESILEHINTLISDNGTQLPFLELQKARSLYFNLMAVRSRLLMQVTQASEFAQKSLTFSLQDSSTFRWRAFSTLGSDAYFQGDLQSADSNLGQAVYHARLEGTYYGVAHCTAYWVETLYHLARIDTAFSEADLSLKWLEQKRIEETSGGPWRYLPYLEILRESNQLEQARRVIEPLLDICTNVPLDSLQQQIIQIRQFHLCLTERDFPSANVALNRIELLQSQSNFVRPFAVLSSQAMRALLALESRKTVEVKQWLDDQLEEMEKNLSFRNEPDYLLAIQCLIYLGRDSESLKHCETLHSYAHAHNHPLTVIRCYILEAIAHQNIGDLPLANEKLRHALQLTQHTKFKRIYLDQLAPIAIILRRLSSDEVVGEYASSLVKSFPVPAALDSAKKNSLLSKRETQLVGLIGQGLTDKEISATLHISVMTVKTHLHNAYKKLGVKNRTQALRVAREKGIVL